MHILSKTRTMRHLYTLLILIGLIGLMSSCKDLDTHTPERAAEKIKGTWTIRKVENNVKNDGKWSRNDVTDDFQDWIFSFEENGYASLRIPEENLFVEGGWEVYENIDYDTDGERTTNIELYMYFFHPTSNEYREFYWQDMKVSSSLFKAREKRTISGQKVTYFYELVK